MDRSLAELHEHADEFARLAPSLKAALLRECIPRLLDGAPEWVAKGCQAKSLPMSECGEEWLAGPMPTIRMARLLAESLDRIGSQGRPPLGRSYGPGTGNRLRVDVFPNSMIDSALFQGLEGYVLMQEGIDSERAEEMQASFYRSSRPAGGVSLILGAGNVSSIPPMDVFSKMFIEGKVALLKMNPVNEWVGPCLERALDPLIARGFLRIVYGGSEVGAYLCASALLADVHITGSEATHDLIVWGPEGEERERRKRAGDPRLAVPISSELGNVSPVAIVPFEYTSDELLFQARNVATMLCNNASFNCNAAKMLITGKGWPQRERFMDLLRANLETVPTRRAYYPGAFERYERLTRERDKVTRIGQSSAEQLPWTLIEDVDASKQDDPLFRVEPFCSILSETQVGSGDPIEFLSAATDFMNNTLWGTLNATIIISPLLKRAPTVRVALDKAILDLRYGTVAINHWPALCYGMTTLPWGGHASASLDDIQSGLGWVHNTYMLAGIDKSVVHGAIKIWPEPPWFVGNRAAAKLGPRLARMEARPSWGRVPGIALSALLK